jgi:uncharacterized protein (TIGR00725 family)
MNVPAPTLFLDRRHGCLHDGAGLLFDGAAHAWRGAPHVASAFAGERIEPIAAVRWLQRESGTPSRPTIGVIGTRHGTLAQLAAARALGEALADMGLVVLCGGRRGIMLAVCEGVATGGGISVGLLPGDTPNDGNARVTIPLPTGIGLARNALIARAAQCLIAIGGGHGTLSEIAFGLQFGKRVFLLEDAPYVAGCEIVADVAAAIDAVARVVLGLDGDVALPDARSEA